MNLHCLAISKLKWYSLVKKYNFYVSDATRTQTRPSKKLRVVGEWNPGWRHIGWTPSTTDSTAFHAFCYALLARNKNELVSVLTFPEHSSFHLGDQIYLNVHGDHIELKRGMMVVEFPPIRWKMFETYLEDMDEAVEHIRNNRYSSVIEHLGGNVYVTG